MIASSPTPTEQARTAPEESLGLRFNTWTVLHPHVPLLRGALAAPVLAWRLGLGPTVSRVSTAGAHLVLLTVTGRTTGMPHHLPVALHELDGVPFLWCPYGSRAQWYRNLVVNPVVTIQGTTTRTMRASAVDDVDDLRAIAARLREFDETFWRSYLASEGIDDSPEGIDENLHRLHVRRLEPTAEPGPPLLQADLVGLWLVLPAVAALVLSARAARRGPVPRARGRGPAARTS